MMSMEQENRGTGFSRNSTGINSQQNKKNDKRLGKIVDSYSALYFYRWHF